MQINKEQLINALNGAIFNIDKQKDAANDTFAYTKLDIKKRAYEELISYINEIAPTPAAAATVKNEKNQG